MEKLGFFDSFNWFDVIFNDHLQKFKNNFNCFDKSRILTFLFQINIILYESNFNFILTYKTIDRNQD